MSTNTLPLTASAGSTRLSGFAGAVARRLVGLAQAWRHRKDLEMLGTFDDRMLADIGLTRGDLRDAVAELPWRDPSALLVKRAGERRRLRHIVTHHDAPPTAPEIDAASSALFPPRSRYY